MSITFQPTRRQFLKSGGALVVAFTLSPALIGRAYAQGLPVKPLTPDEVDTFLQIDTEGKVTLFTGKVDLGTGVRIALQQIVAEELDVPLASMHIVQGDTALTPDQSPTYGSKTIEIGGMVIRQAAATARQALLEQAAQHLEVDKNTLSVVDGVVSADDGKQVTYAALVGGKHFSLKLNADAPTKKPSDYKLVGQSIRRQDIPEKLTGRFTFIHDFRVDGMLYGSVVRPPALKATLNSVDEASIKDIPGRVQVVRKGNFVAVVAESEWAAIRAARELKVDWSSAESLPEQSKLWEHVRATKVASQKLTSNIGDTASAMAEEGTKMTATYDFAIQTHGSIGPSCAVSEFKDGVLTCWTASQATHNLRQQLANMLSLPLEKVRCIYVAGAGCYGRNGHEDAAGDSALLTTLVGKPVRVQWTRAEEHGWSPKGAPILVDLRANVDKTGAVKAWEGDFYLPQKTGDTVDLVSAAYADMPAENFLSPGGIDGDSAIPYQFPNVKTHALRLETTPLRPAWIRTPGRMQNTFANESFLDEIATELAQDPLEFRLKHLDASDTRGRAVLERLRKISNWEPQSKPRMLREGTKLKGRGVSYVKYELVRTYVGIVVDIEVDSALGDVRVTKVYVVHDCGQIINPNGVRAQIEGSVIQTMSRTLKEEIKFDRSMVTSLDWATYPILRFTELPELVIDLIDMPNAKPWGAGEPAAAVVPSAIANAIFDASGARLRSVPFRREHVRAALKV